MHANTAWTQFQIILFLPKLVRTSVVIRDRSSHISLKHNGFTEHSQLSF